MSTPKEHKHPGSPRNKIFGIKLEKGDILQPGDVYPSADGKWRESHLKDITLGDGIRPQSFFWVRPAQNLEEKRD